MLSYYGLCLLLSLLFGSVLNVVIYRLPLMLHRRWQAQYAINKDAQAINLFFPRSFCRHCKHTVAIWHNIPLLSYALLKGKCAYCHDKISSDYPLVELLFCILALTALARFGLTPRLLSALLFLALMICLTWIDKNQQLLPDELSLSLLWLGLLVNLNQQFVPLHDAVIGAISGYLSLWLIMHGYRLLTNKIGMGHGDFKLFAALGAWFGWSLLPLMLLFSATMGALVGGVYLYRQGKSIQTPIPFGPFLCLSGTLVLFFTPDVLKTWFL